MSAFMYTPCVMCGKEDPNITVYAGNVGYPIGKKCWKLAEKLHQLNLIDVDKKLEDNNGK